MSIGGFDMDGNLNGHEVSATNPAATSSLDSSGSNNRGNILPDRLSVILRDVWGDAAPAAVHQYTGRPDRTCRAWCPEEGTTPVEAGSSALIAILRGKEGFRVLRRAMQPDPPEWFVEISLALEIKRAIDGVGK